DREVDRLVPVVGDHDPVVHGAAGGDRVAVVLPVRPELVRGGPNRPGDVAVVRGCGRGAEARHDQESRENGEQEYDDGAGERAHRWSSGGGCGVGAPRRPPWWNWSGQLTAVMV